MIKLIRWLLILVALLVLLGVIVFISKDAITRKFLEETISARTGMETRIGKVTVGIANHGVTVENLKMFNKAEFGGLPFLDLPEVHVEYDVPAFEAHRIHLKLVRLTLAEMTVVLTPQGQMNVAGLEKKALDQLSQSRTNLDGYTFTGIDTLNITLGKAHVTLLGTTNAPQDYDFGIHNQIFTNLVTEDDFNAVGLTLMLRSGPLGQLLSNPKLLLKSLAR